MKGFLWFTAIALGMWGVAWGESAPISEDSETCIECHAVLNPGIVAAWRKSRHALVTPETGMKKEKLGRRISAKEVPEKLRTTAVGCAECHTLNADKHADTFEHNDYDVHIVVTPKDCAVCHPDEDRQYAENVMSLARVNLMDNPIYMSLLESINGSQDYHAMKTSLRAPNPETNADSCSYCHGTQIEVKGMREVETDLADVVVPVLSGWPNHGVGRFNPDGSKGSCTPCHTRHHFSIEMARSPYTCAECHKGPDVPAFPVYKVSKHGNIFSAMGKTWDFDNVPWQPGEDFAAPTCAACHVSLLVSEDEEVIVERTHRMNNRISQRLFGIIYAHAHPKSPNTSIIRNGDGLSLATDFMGAPASDYLIDTQEQNKRRDTMKKVCLVCHGSGWVNGHFDRLKNTIDRTNEVTLTATKLMLMGWEKGLAKGLQQGDSIFNEAIEKKWVEVWLFYANSTRLASAMGGADYGVFANGRWYLSKTIQEMVDWLEFKTKDSK